jgi:hypothetical protein
MKKLFGGIVAVMIVGIFSSVLWLNCIVNSNVSDDEYARMAQELVDQSIER